MNTFPSEPPPQHSEGGASRALEELTQSIRRRVWLVVAVAMVVVLATAAYTLSQTKIYRAVASLQLDPRPPQPLGRDIEAVTEVGTGSWWSDLKYYNTQYQIITSNRVALDVVRELSLHTDEGFIKNRVHAAPRRGPPIAPEVAAKLLQKRLFVIPVKESRLVQVAFEDADRTRATRILEAVIRSYMSNNLHTATATTASAAEWLTEQLEVLRQELDASELALHHYKKEKNILSLSLDDQTNILQREMQQVAEARSEVRAKIQGALARVTQLRSIDADNSEVIPQTELLRSERLLALQMDFLKARQEAEALQGAGKGENHPETKAVAARLNNLRSALAVELRNIQSGAAKELAALQQEEGGLTALLKNAEKEALDLNMMEIEYYRLQRTKENNEKLYSVVMERTKEAGLSRMLTMNNIQVVDSPSVSKLPVKPRVPLMLGLGGFAGLLLGLGVALVRERMDRTIKSTTDLEERIGILSLGHVPTIEDKSLGAKVGKGRRRRPQADDALGPELYIHNNPQSGLAEAIRAIRTNLLFMSPDKPFRRLLVTSPSPSEGKTTVACCLGITMAQAGHRVLLIDCDMRKPRLDRVFHRGRSPSTLSETLIEPARLALPSLVTEIPNLSVLPAGPPPPNPAELLHSRVFRDLLERLDKSFDLVLLDTPPLIVTDAAILAGSVDGCVVVARAGVTDRPHLARSVRSLRDVGGNVVGAILNAINPHSRSYGYVYGKYYNSAYGQTEKDQESKTVE